MTNRPFSPYRTCEVAPDGSSSKPQFLMFFSSKFLYMQQNGALTHKALNEPERTVLLFVNSPSLPARITRYPR